MSIITFTSDFGLRDAYVGVVHGVIAGIAPQARVIDLTHGIPPQDVRAGALALYTGYPYFPDDTIHLAVVDPGVGTERRALLLRTARHWFLGPDNGLFSLVAPSESLLGCWDLTSSRYRLPTTAATFQGRDLFGPVAAHLAAGVPPHELGTPTAPPLARPDLVLDEVRLGTTVGTVLAVDHFGNMVTNLRAPSDWLDMVAQRRITAWLGDAPLRPVYTYADAAALREPADMPGLVLLAGSSGLLEVAVANGSAARVSGFGVGTLIRSVVG
jgi:S-adenosylmethionine hydrolase